MLVCEASHGLSPANNRLVKLLLILKTPVLLRFGIASSSQFLKDNLLLTPLLLLFLCIYTQTIPPYCKNIKNNYLLQL